MAPKCHNCCQQAILKRPKTLQALCKECFFICFEEEIHNMIISEKLFESGETVGIGASGGKDSTVLIHVLKVLNERYNYGLKLILISIDEGIAGYRDDSLETVHLNQKSYDLPLKIFSYKDLYGWTMDEIVRQVGNRNNCTICGVFRRQALDRGAALLSVNKIATGHNADDMAETVLMNVLRGDSSRLARCTTTVTDSFRAAQSLTNNQQDCITRCKPLKYCYQKEIVMYAHFKKLDYFATECTYAPNSFRGYVRSFIKDLERLYPSSILNIIRSGQDFTENTTDDSPFTYLPAVNSGGCGCTNKARSDPKSDKIIIDAKNPSESQESISSSGSKLKICARCSYVSSQEICKACQLLEKLNLGRPALVVSEHT